MASTVNLVDTEPVIFPHIGGTGTIKEYEINLDGISGPLLIAAPSAGNRLWIVGALFSEASAGNLVFRSGVGPSKIKTLKLAGYQGSYDKVSAAYIFSTKMEEELYLDSTIAFSSITLHVADLRAFMLG